MTTRVDKTTPSHVKPPNPGSSNSPDIDCGYSSMEFPSVSSSMRPVVGHQNSRSEQTGSTDILAKYLGENHRQALNRSQYTRQSISSSATRISSNNEIIQRLPDRYPAEKFSQNPPSPELGSNESKSPSGVVQTYHGRTQSHGLPFNRTNGSPVNNLLTNSPLSDRMALYQTLWRNQTANFLSKQNATPVNHNKSQSVSIINRVCQSAGSSRNITSSYPDENGFSSYLRRSRRSDGNDKPEAIYSSPTPKNACNSLLPAACFPKNRVPNIDSKYLLDKETEIRRLREIMASNEAAILQVLNDKKREWESTKIAQLRELERQIQTLQENIARKEKAWKSQLSDLEQANKGLQVRVKEIGSENERLRQRNVEMEAELEKLKASGRNDGGTVGHIPGTANSEPSDDSCMGKLDASQSELPAGTDLNKCRLEFCKEREKWLLEKKRVIDYQQLLQVNYLKMVEKNRLLESKLKLLQTSIIEI